MGSRQQLRFGVWAALLFQALCLCACLTQPEPVASAMNEGATTVTLPTETILIPSATMVPSSTAQRPTPTLAPTATNEPAPTAVKSAPLAAEALIQALQQGGFVIYFRHAATDVTQTDSSTANFQDCSTQRNLNPQGRADALAIGEAILTLGIPIGQVHSSAYCRARDTAMLAFGQAEITQDLTGFPTDQTEQRIAALREMLSTPPIPGTNTILVAHGFQHQQYGRHQPGGRRSGCFRPSRRRWFRPCRTRAS